VLKAKIVTSPMTEEEFLSVLRQIVEHRKENAPQKKGYTKDAFSRAFARVGHPDGGPGFIRVADNYESGPICEAARFFKVGDYGPKDWREAARAIGLPDELAKSIEEACELSLDRDPGLYRRLLDACDLPHSEEDEEDIEYAKRQVA